ncbi:SDR family oxidoreductase [Burkholderia gladioli]|uniref:SDR family oxidoreductase n=1 Tax=Burkholderia gladioli TaxID=28095 RepID=UPI0034DB02D1
MTKTVLITGTSSGIGEAAVRVFLADGWYVVATARDPAAILRGTDNPNLLTVRLDLTDTGTIAAAFEAAETRFGSIDVVVNNAGIGLGGPLEGVSLAQLREHFEVNVIGVAAVCQAAASHMRPRSHGLIINITSLTGRAGLPFLAPYSASKFAVEGMTEALHYELRPFGIRVKLVEPGGARTRFAHPWANHPAYLPTADKVREMMTKGAQVAAPPEDVAKVILTAANDSGDRLRYAATDAVPMLRMKRVLPEWAWRKMLARAFGLSI